MTFYNNVYIPNSFELFDLMDFVDSLPDIPPDNGKFFWILKNSDYVNCLKCNLYGEYSLIKQGNPDTMLNIPIIIDNSVENSCVFNFTNAGHQITHKNLLRYLDILLDDYKKQGNDIGRNSLLLDFIDWAMLQCALPSGEATEHKLYPHYVESE